MRILYNKIYPNSVTQNYFAKGVNNKTFCRGSTEKYLNSAVKIKKLSSVSEYEKILNHLKDTKVWSGWWNRGNNIEQGLMPYIGSDDISFRINKYLRDGELVDNRYSKESMENIIKLFDFSLNEIDRQYGKYEGFVYRYGKTDKDSKNYVSAAREPKGVTMIISDGDKHKLKEPFYIIYTKNGHKAEEVQKKLNFNPVYADESEIIISPAKFEEIKCSTAEMQIAKDNLLSALRKEHIYPNTEITFLKEI